MLDTTFSKNLSYWDLDLQCISCSLKPFMNFFFSLFMYLLCQLQSSSSITKEPTQH